MFRALSTRRSRLGYEQLVEDDEVSTASLMPKLSRAKSQPAAKMIIKSSKKITTATSTTQSDQQIKKAGKVHPFFSLFETKRKRKGTTKPEFLRYLEYVKEGGTWDMKTNKPVIYYN